MRIIFLTLFVNVGLIFCQQQSKEMDGEVNPTSRLLFPRAMNDTTIIIESEKELDLTSTKPHWDWVKKVVKTGSITPMAYANTALDSLGNTYITNFAPTLNNLEDVLVAKYDPEGILVWEVLMGGVGRDAGHDIAIDGHGQIWVTGYFQEQANFGKITLTGDHLYNLFLAKLDVNGVCKSAYKVASDNQGFSYAKGTIGDGQLGGFSISITRTNEIILSGEFERVLKFDDIHLTSVRDRSSFVAKIDLSGKCIWATMVESSNWCYSSIAYISSHGDSYFLSQCADTLFVGDKKVFADQDLSKPHLLAKINKDGQCEWIKQINYRTQWEAPREETKRRSVPDTRERFYLPIRLDHFKNHSTQFFDREGSMLLAEFELSGDISKIIPLGDGPDVSERTIWTHTADNIGNIYVAGYFSGDAYFGDQMVKFSRSERQSGYVAKYNADGDCDWVKVITCYGKILWPRSMRVDNDALYLSGNYQQSADFDNFRIETSEQDTNVHEIFLARLNLE